MRLTSVQDSVSGHDETKHAHILSMFSKIQALFTHFIRISVSCGNPEVKSKHTV